MAGAHANIEEILTAADALATTRASWGGAHPRDFALLALSARSEIWQQLARRAATDFLDPLAAHLPRLGPLPLFPLNNDLIVETWCHRRRGILSFDPSSLAQSRAAVRLYKLHGSVDWEEQGETGIRRFRGKFRTTAGQVPLRTPVPDVALVFPSRVKRFANSALLDLLLAFRGALRSLNLLVIVGCQLVDPHVALSIAEACRERPRLQLLVVDPSPDAALERLLAHAAKHDLSGRVDALRLGFGEAQPPWRGGQDIAAICRRQGGDER
jgi:hypothetical protein